MFNLKLYIRDINKQKLPIDQFTSHNIPYTNNCIFLKIKVKF